MAIRPIVKLGDDVLRRTTEPVTEFGAELNALIDDMVETMYDAPGVGLAANQIGIPLDLMIIDTTVGQQPGKLHVFANARIIHAEGEQTGEEGCLSVPGFTEQLTRPAHVKVKYQDREGEWREIEGTELMARALCHEIDHLRGVVYVDLLRGLKKERLLKRVRKLQKKDEW
jgi:peptide deformylase